MPLLLRETTGKEGLGIYASLRQCAVSPKGGGSPVYTFIILVQAWVLALETSFSHISLAKIINYFEMITRTSPVILQVKSYKVSSFIFYTTLHRYLEKSCCYSLSHLNCNWCIQGKVAPYLLLQSYSHRDICRIS